MNPNTTPEASEKQDKLPLALQIAQGIIDEKKGEIEQRHQVAIDEYTEAHEKEQDLRLMRDWLNGIEFYGDVNLYEKLEEGIESYKTAGMEFSKVVEGLLKKLGDEYKMFDSAVDLVVESGAISADEARARILGNEQIQLKFKEAYEATMLKMREEMEEAWGNASKEKQEALAKTGEFKNAVVALGQGVQMSEIAPDNLETMREIFKQKQLDYFINKPVQEKLRRLNEHRNKGKLSEFETKLKQQELLRDVVGPYLVDMMIKRIEDELRKQNPQNTDEVLKEFYSQTDFGKEYKLRFHNYGFEVEDKDINVITDAKNREIDGEIQKDGVVVLRGKPKKEDLLIVNEIARLQALQQLVSAVDEESRSKFYYSALMMYYLTGLMCKKYDPDKVKNGTINDTIIGSKNNDDLFSSGMIKYKNYGNYSNIIYSDFADKLPNLDAEFVGLMQALHKFSLEKTGGNEQGDIYIEISDPARATKLSSTFNAVYEKKTRDGIGYVPQFKDEIVRGYKEAAKALEQYDAKKGQEGRAILTVEQARDTVSKIQMEAVAKIDEVTAQLDELQKQQEKQAKEMQRAIDKITGESKGEKVNLTQAIEQFKQSAQEWQQEGLKLGGELKDAHEEIERLKVRLEQEKVSLKRNAGDKAELAKGLAKLTELVTQLQESESKKGAIKRMKSGDALAKVVAWLEELEKGQFNNNMPGLIN